MAIKSKKISRTPRERTKFRTRRRMQGTDERPRLSVFKSSKYTYAQIISDLQGRTLAAASTMEKEVQDAIAKLKGEETGDRSKSTKSVSAARALGIVIAERAKGKKITKVVYDRNGFLYHGRIKAVSDGAREGGLEF